MSVIYARLSKEFVQTRPAEPQLPRSRRYAYTKGSTFSLFVTVQSDLGHGDALTYVSAVYDHEQPYVREYPSVSQSGPYLPFGFVIGRMSRVGSSTTGRVRGVEEKTKGGGELAGIQRFEPGGL